jgi:hypothetical protein
LSVLEILLLDRGVPRPGHGLEASEVDGLAGELAHAVLSGVDLGEGALDVGQVRTIMRRAAERFVLHHVRLRFVHWVGGTFVWFAHRRERRFVAHEAGSLGEETSMKLFDLLGRQHVDHLPSLSILSVYHVKCRSTTLARDP